MACYWAKEQLTNNPESPLIVKIVGISSDSFKTEEQVIKKVLEKKVPGLKFDQIFSVRKKNSTVWYVASCDKDTIVGLLKMHMQRCQLNRLQTWVLDYEGYLDLADDDVALALLSESKSIKEQMNISKGKPVYQKVKKEETFAEGEFQITRQSKKK